MCWKGAFVLFSRGFLQKKKKTISSHCERPLLFRHTCNKTLVYTTEILLTAVGLRLLTAAPRVTFFAAQESSHKNSSLTKTLREIMTSLTGYGTLSIEYKSNSNNISMILPLLSIVCNEQLHFAVIRDCEAHFNLLQQPNSQLHKKRALVQRLL